MGLSTLATAVPTGSYVNGLLAIPVVILLMAWARALSWADKDAESARLPRDWLNVGLLGGFVLAFAGFILTPNFFLALLVPLVVIGIETGVYLSMRKKTVGLSDLKGDFQAWVRSIGRREKVVAEVAGAVQLVGPDGKLLPAPKANTPEAESFGGIQRMLTDPLVNGAQTIKIEPAETGSVVKYSVDGVEYTGTTVPKNIGADAIAYLKIAAGLDMGEVRKPQKGKLKINLNGKRMEMAFETKGSTAGEYARFVADAAKRHDFTPQTLGFTKTQLDTIRSVVDGGGGVTLLTTPRGAGLTSLSYGMLRAHDAFLKTIMTVERDPEQDLEGITQNKLDRNASPAEEAKQVNWIISQRPDVMLLSKPESPTSAIELLKYSKEGPRVYFSFHANSTFEALSIWRKLVGDDKLAVSQLNLVINGRNLRKLCSACKQAYNPDPETLRKMNIDATKVDTLYQARKEPIRDPKGNPIKCEFCNDLRYKGRTGMYELLLVDEHIRQIATNSMTAEQNAAPMKAAFRKQKGRYLQEVGLAMVEAGETSVQEVLRVMKPPPEQARPPSGGSAGRSTSPRRPAPASPPAEA